MASNTSNTTAGEPTVISVTINIVRTVLTAVEITPAVIFLYLLKKKLPPNFARELRIASALCYWEIAYLLGSVLWGLWDLVYSAWRFKIPLFCCFLRIDPLLSYLALLGTGVNININTVDRILASRSARLGEHVGGRLQKLGVWISLVPCVAFIAAILLETEMKGAMHRQVNGNCDGAQIYVGISGMVIGVLAIVMYISYCCLSVYLSIVLGKVEKDIKRVEEANNQENRITSQEERWLKSAQIDVIVKLSRAALLEAKITLLFTAMPLIAMIILIFYLRVYISSTTFDALFSLSAVLFSVRFIATPIALLVKHPQLNYEFKKLILKSV